MTYAVYYDVYIMHATGGIFNRQPGVDVDKDAASFLVTVELSDFRHYPFPELSVCQPLERLRDALRELLILSAHPD